jgi:hypothetical protein
MLLGLAKKLFFLSLVVLVASVLFTCYIQYRAQKQTEAIEKWGEENKLVVDKSKTKPVPFKVQFDQKEWDTLVTKLELTRYFEPMDRKLVPAFDYGFDPEYSRELGTTSFNSLRMIS